MSTKKIRPASHVNRFIYLALITFVMSIGPIACGVNNDEREPQGTLDTNNIPTNRAPTNNPPTNNPPTNNPPTNNPPTNNPPTNNPPTNNPPTDPYASRRLLADEFVYIKYTTGTIYAYNIQTQTSRLVMELVGPGKLKDPVAHISLSPDRTTVAFVAKGPTGKQQYPTKSVWVANLLTQEVKRISGSLPDPEPKDIGGSNFSQSIRHPQWSHDGRFIWFKGTTSWYNVDDHLVAYSSRVKLETSTGRFSIIDDGIPQCRFANFTVSRSAPLVALFGNKCFYGNIMIYDAKTGATEKLKFKKNVNVDGSLAMFGNKILFDGSTNGNEQPKQSGIFMADIRTGEVNFVTDEGAQSISIHSSGRYVLLQRFGTQGVEHERIVILDLKLLKKFSLNLPKNSSSIQW